MINLRRHAPVLITLGTVALPLSGQIARSVTITHRSSAAPKHLFSIPRAPGRAGPTPTAAERRHSSLRLVVALTPTEPVAGRRLRLRIRQPPPGVIDYRWDLGGTGRYRTNTGRTGSVTKVYRTPGRRSVSVRVRDASGTRIATLRFLIRSGERLQRRTDESSRARPIVVRAKRRGARVRRHDGVRVRRHDGVRVSQRRSRPASRPGAAHAHAATDPAVRIADFAFTPGATTVHVGDTITWTNSGPSSHSATAKDGSFDTGILAKGQSASHTFTHAGTFSYFCRIHPFMHGTIVVLASTRQPAKPAPSPGASPGSPVPTSPTHSAPAPTRSTPAATSPSPTATTSSPSLPMTGLDLASVALAGLAVAGLGLGLRRATSRAD